MLCWKDLKSNKARLILDLRGSVILSVLICTGKWDNNCFMDLIYRRNVKSHIQHLVSCWAHKRNL